MTRVLVADDDAVSRLLLARRLQQRGFACVEAPDGETAWAIMQGADPPRLALLDWNMPGLDGIEVCRRTRKLGREPYTYILLLTGREDPHDVVVGMEAGADDYIRKPLDIDEVEARLRAGRRVLALENKLIEAREHLRREANTDALTGLYNRRALMTRVGREMDRAAREGTAVAAIMVDVDHFKRINDTHGHAAGDAVLAQVASRLRTATRPYDCLGRVGGEEFCAFVSAGHLADARQVGERLRQAVAAEPIAIDGADPVRITCSVGVAPSRLRKEHDASALIARADRALYRAKKAGRNRVEVAGDPERGSPPGAAAPPAADEAERSAEPGHAQRSEAHARQLVDALDTVLAHVPLGLWSVSHDGLFTTSAGAAIAALGEGWRPEVGRRADSLPSFGARDRARLARAQSGHVVHFTHRAGKRTFEVHYAPTQGESGGVSAVALETTEHARHKQMREAVRSAQEIARAKSDFLARMSHEIRTPMNGVLGMVDVLLDTDLSDQQRHFAHTIGTCGKTLVAIIDDILDLSKIEAGKLVLGLRDFDLAQLVEGQALLFAPRVRQKNTRLSVLIDPALPGAARGDPVRLAQVIANLIGNAQKFTSGGRIVVRARRVPAPDASALRLRVEVEDTGAGIDANIASTLFTPYVQGPIGGQPPAGGTGLGLSIAKHLIDAMGGHIGVDSCPGVGSTFYFEVPLGHAAQAEPRSSTAPTLTGHRVLVVEDDPVTREVLATYLGRVGVDATFADHGAAAWAAVRGAPAGRPFDVAIIDRYLPDVDGHTLWQEMAALDAASRPRRAVLTTAWEAPGEAVSAFSGGFDDFIAKPIRRDELWRALGVATQAVRGQAGEESREDAEALGRLTRMRILVAEDNLVNQVVVSRLLAKLGCQVDIVGDGRGALAALAAGGVDAVLMDCQMPNMDGFEAARLWRRREAEKGGHVPIVALTASALPADRTRCRQAGMDDFLAKPIDKERLRRLLFGLAARGEASP